MARRRRVEDDVIEAARRLGVAEQLGELVERRDLDGARAGELLLDARDRGIRQLAAIRADDALAIGARGLLRIDVERFEPIHRRNRRRLRAEMHAEHLVEIRCRDRC